MNPYENTPPEPTPAEDAFTDAEMTNLLTRLLADIRGIDPEDLPEEVRTRIRAAVVTRRTRRAFDNQPDAPDASGNHGAAGPG